MPESHHWDVVTDQTPPPPKPEVVPSIDFRGIAILVSVALAAALIYGVITAE